MQETRDGPHSLYSIVDNLKPPLHTLVLRMLGRSFHETFAGCRDNLFHNLLQMEEMLGHLCLRCGGYQHQEKNCPAQALSHLPRDQFSLYCTLCSRRGHLSSTCLNEPSLQRDYQPRPPQSGFRTCDSSFQAGTQPQAPNQHPAYPPLNTQRPPQPQQPQRPQQNQGAPQVTNNKGFFVGVFLGEVWGGRIGGGGVCSLQGPFAGFGQRVCIGVWPGR